MWRRARRWLAPSPRKDLLALLCREYVDKRKDAMQFRRHAEQMRYRQFREQLLRIAEEEEQHADWLKERIIALGGEAPQISLNPEDRWNNWAELSLDLYEEKRHEWDLRDQLPEVERIDPGTAKVLGRIFADERRHQSAVMEMLMRTDPQAALT
jgi:bacterioferritin (cytochrome b1)